MVRILRYIAWRLKMNIVIWRTDTVDTEFIESIVRRFNGHIYLALSKQETIELMETLHPDIAIIECAGMAETGQSVTPAPDNPTSDPETSQTIKSRRQP